MPAARPPTYADLTGNTAAPAAIQYICPRLRFRTRRFLRLNNALARIRERLGQFLGDDVHLFGPPHTDADEAVEAWRGRLADKDAARLQRLQHAKGIAAVTATVDGDEVGGGRHRCQSVPLGDGVDAL